MSRGFVVALVAIVLGLSVLIGLYLRWTGLPVTLDIGWAILVSSIIFVLARRG